MRFYERVGHIELVTANGELITSLDGLDFRFHVEKNIGGVRDIAQVSILGMNYAEISYFCTFRDDASNIKRRRRVRVYAGYKEEGESLIIDGDIVKATPTMPPDNWLNLTVITNAYRNRELLTFGMTPDLKWNQKVLDYSQQHGYSIKDILDRLVVYAKLKGWRLDYTVKDKTKLNMSLYTRVKSFDCSGTLQDVIRSINFLGDWIVREQEGMLVVSDVDPSNYDVGLNTGVKVLSADSGLVGIPQYKYPYCMMTTRITSSIKIFDIVELKCRYNIEANGLYKVYTITYDGQLRGQPWYAKLDARNIEAPLTDQEKEKMAEKK